MNGKWLEEMVGREFCVAHNCKFCFFNLCCL